MTHDFQHEKRSMLLRVLCIALIVLFAYPVVVSVHLTFLNYSPVRGLWGSEMVGTKHFAQLLRSSSLPRLIANSFRLSLAGLLAGFVIGAPLAWLCSRVKQGFLFGLCAGLVLVPAFFPQSCYALVQRQMAGTAFWAEPGSYTWAYALRVALPNASVFAFSGALFSRLEERHTRGLIQGLLIAGLLCLMTLPLPNYEANALVQNAAVFSQADTLDSYVYRSGLLQNAYSGSAAAYVLRMALQVLCGALGVFALLRSGALESRATDRLQEPSDSGVAPAAILVGIMALLALLAIFALGLPQVMPSMLGTGLLSGLRLVGVSFVVACIVFAALIYGLPNFSTSMTLVAGLALMIPCYNMVGQYLTARMLGLLNTPMATALFAWQEPWLLCLALIMALYLQKRGSMRAAPLFVLCLALITCAKALGGVFPELIMINNRSNYTLALLLRESMAASGTPVPEDMVSVQASLYVATVLPCLALAGLSATGMAFALKEPGA